MKIVMVCIVIILSALIGAFWAFALNCNMMIGLVAGGIIGIPVGLLAGFLQKAISTMSNTTIHTIASLFVAPSLILYFMSGITAGLIMWLIRVAIF